MKKLITALLAFLILFGSCGQDDLSSKCEQTCENESILEIVENVEGKIVNIKNVEEDIDYWFIDIDPSFVDSEGYSTSNETTLVPCNLNDEDRIDQLKVFISGMKLSCCNLITFPHLRTSWGCKFEITSIESQSSNL